MDNSRMRCFVAMLCRLAVTSCNATGPTSSGPINQELVLAPGQSAPITAAGITLRFLGVPTDSRCPADVMCVLPGSASVDIQVTSFASAQISFVRFETGNLKPFQIGPLTLELLQLAPYPFGVQPINPADYRATVRVRR